MAKRKKYQSKKELFDKLLNWKENRPKEMLGSFEFF
jgi:hypothetical protein